MVIVDDMISTGGTIVNAVSILDQLGARRVFAACTHGLFVDGASIRLMGAGVYDVIATDTVESFYSKVSVAPVLMEAIRSLADDFE